LLLSQELLLEDTPFAKNIASALQDVVIKEVFEEWIDKSPTWFIENSRIIQKIILVHFRSKTPQEIDGSDPRSLAGLFESHIEQVKNQRKAIQAYENSVAYTSLGLTPFTGLQSIVNPLNSFLDQKRLKSENTGSSEKISYQPKVGPKITFHVYESDQPTRAYLDYSSSNDAFTGALILINRNLNSEEKETVLLGEVIKLIFIAEGLNGDGVSAAFTILSAVPDPNNQSVAERIKRVLSPQELSFLASPIKKNEQLDYLRVGSLKAPLQEFLDDWRPMGIPLLSVVLGALVMLMVNLMGLDVPDGGIYSSYFIVTAVFSLMAMFSVGGFYLFLKKHKESKTYGPYNPEKLLKGSLVLYVGAFFVSLATAVGLAIGTDWTLSGVFAMSGLIWFITHVILHWIWDWLHPKRVEEQSDVQEKLRELRLLPYQSSDALREGVRQLQESVKEEIKTQWPQASSTPENPQTAPDHNQTIQEIMHLIGLDYSLTFAQGNLSAEETANYKTQITDLLREILGTEDFSVDLLPIDTSQTQQFERKKAISSQSHELRLNNALAGLVQAFESGVRDGRYATQKQKATPIKTADIQELTVFHVPRDGKFTEDLIQQIENRLRYSLDEEKIGFVSEGRNTKEVLDLVEGAIKDPNSRSAFQSLRSQGRIRAVQLQKLSIDDLYTEFGSPAELALLTLDPSLWTGKEAAVKLMEIISATQAIPIQTLEQLEQQTRGLLVIKTQA
jgi:hypothetical protein